MNRRILVVFLAFLALLTIIAPAFAEPTYDTVNGVFTDKERDRAIPYKLYAPKRVRGPAPVVIFSHGLGGSTSAAPYLGQALAEHGYYVFHIQHPGSDAGIWKGKGPLQIKDALKDSLKDPQVMIDRYTDLPFVIDELERMNKKSGPFEGKLDLEKIGMAGHSYGARGVMAAAGESNGVVGASFKDPRVKAGLVLSPNVPLAYLKLAEKDDRKAQDELKQAYAAIDIPLFHITGTLDADPIGIYGEKFTPEMRTIPYKNIGARDQYLLVLDGANHAVFGSGERAVKTSRETKRSQAVVAAGAALFFDAYLKNDARAYADLRKSYPEILGDKDTFEFK